MSTRLFVGNLHPEVTEEQLEEFFSETGDVVAVSIPLDRETEEPRGFGFVEFRTSAAAQEAQASLDDTLLQGRRLRLRPAHDNRSRGERERGRPRPRAGWEEGDEDDGGFQSPRGGRSSEEEDYSGRRRAKPKKRGRHGSDRKRGRGTRRLIE